MEIGEVRDLYQASYYLLSGCELVEVECYEEGRAVNSKLYFRGESIKALESNWYSRRAMANLWAFRLAYSQIHSYISEAKKKYEGSKRGQI